MSKEQRQSSKLLKPRSFDTHKNAAVPIMAMLGCSELDIEVSLMITERYPERTEILMVC